MEIILITVFILAFLVSSWLLELLDSHNGFPVYMGDAYARIRGDDSTGRKRKLRNLQTVRRISRNISWKKVLPVWTVLYLASLVLVRNLLIAFFFSLMLYLALHMYRKVTGQIKRKELFIYQFREALISMSNSLKAGASLPAAIGRCKTELSNTLRIQPEKPMLRELEIMVNEINMGKSLAEVLGSFQKRMNLEEVDNFVNAAIITEKTGGNLSEVMVNVCTMIGDRIQMKREIESLTAGKRSESRVLTIAPIIILPALALLSPSYLKPMYDTLLGKSLMVLAVMLLVTNYIVGKKIMNIRL